MSGDCWIMGTYGGRYYPVETVDYLEDMLSEGGYEEESSFLTCTARHGYYRLGERGGNAFKNGTWLK